MAFGRAIIARLFGVIHLSQVMARVQTIPLLLFASSGREENAEVHGD